MRACVFECVNASDKIGLKVRNKLSVKYFKPFSGAKAHVTGSHSPCLLENYLRDKARPAC